MSQKPNDKKPQQQSPQQQKLIDAQKLQLFQYAKTIKQQQSELFHLKTQYYKIQQQSQLRIKSYTKTIQLLNINSSAVEDRLKQVITQKAETEIKLVTCHLKLEKMDIIIKNLEQSKQRQFQQFQKRVNSQFLKYEQQISQYENSINDHTRLTKQNNALRQKIKDQRNDFIQIIADKDRERIQAIDKLKTQTLVNIRDLKVNLLSMRRDQMSTNTRLTVLQNHQLLQQLQFQSKHTQKILQKNIQLQSKVKQLTKQLQIQNEVENQIVQRSIIFKAIISKIKHKNEELDNQILSLTQQLCKVRQIERTNIKKQYEIMNLDVMTNLQNELIAYRGKYDNILKQNQQLTLTNKLYKKQLDKIRKEGDKLVGLLLRYYKDILSENIQTNCDQEYIYDINTLKNKNISEWNAKDCQITVKILLNLIKNKLELNNIEIPYLKKVLIIGSQKQAIQQIYQSQSQQRYQIPKSLSSHHPPLNKPSSQEKYYYSLKKKCNLLNSIQKRRNLSLCSTPLIKTSQTPSTNKQNFNSKIKKKMKQWGPVAQLEQSVMQRFYKKSPKV